MCWTFAMRLLYVIRQKWILDISTDRCPRWSALSNLIDFRPDFFFYRPIEFIIRNLIWVIIIVALHLCNRERNLLFMCLYHPKSILYTQHNIHFYRISGFSSAFSLRMGFRHFNRLKIFIRIDRNSNAPIRFPFLDFFSISSPKSFNSFKMLPNPVLRRVQPRRCRKWFHLNVVLC